MIELVAFVGLLLPKVMPFIVGLMLWALLREIQKQKAKKPQQRAKLHIKPLAAKPHDSRVKPETEKRLYAMCGGDRALVQRLTKGGGQAAWEKAIYELERDRH